MTVAVRAGADVNSTDASLDGWTALHRAAEKGHARVARILLYYRAGVDPADSLLGNTPLHLAAQQVVLAAPAQRPPPYIPPLILPSVLLSSCVCLPTNRAVERADAGGL